MMLMYIINLANMREADLSFPAKYFSFLITDHIPPYTLFNQHISMLTAKTRQSRENLELHQDKVVPRMERRKMMLSF